MHVCPESGDSATAPGTCDAHPCDRVASEGDELLGMAVGPYRIARLLEAGGMGRV
ncbi:MAG: hypothetical protein GY811_26710 [Myxococcales bacterium]|nr:hypothetical protein [Myxococcales bacterium]